MLIFSWLLLRMRNISDKGCKENQKPSYIRSPTSPPRKSCLFWDNVKKSKSSALSRNNGYTNATQFYIIHTLPILFLFFCRVFSFVSHKFCCIIPQWRWNVWIPMRHWKKCNVPLTVDAFRVFCNRCMTVLWNSSTSPIVTLRTSSEHQQGWSKTYVLKSRNI